jgi:hypothetical protein
MMDTIRSPICLFIRNPAGRDIVPFVTGLTKTSRIGKPAHENEIFSAFSYFGAFFGEGDMIKRLEESRWARRG